MIEEQYHSMPRGVLAVTLLLTFGIWAPLIAIPPLESVLSSQFEISHALSGLLFSAPIAVLALTAIPAGFLADRIGLKQVIGIGAVVVALGSALRGAATSFGSLLSFDLLYGLGLGLVFPNLPKLARHCSIRERAGITIGSLTAAILLAGALALAITVPLVYSPTGSLRAVFYIWSIPAAAAALLWVLLIRDPPCASAGIEPVRFGMAALRRVVGRRQLWLVAFLFLLHNVVLYAWVGWIPEFLRSIGAGDNSAGLIASLTFWIGIPSVLLLARLSFRIGRRKPFLWAPSIMLALVCAGVLLNNIALSWALMMLVGVAASIRFTTILALPVEMVLPGEGGSASGLVMSVGYIGALVGPFVGGLVLDHTGRFEGIFIFLAVVSLVNTGVALLAPETGRRGGS